MSQFLETEVRETVNGEVIRHETSIQRRVADDQDDFIKLYVRMIGAINKVPHTANPLLNALLRRVSYADEGQRILLNKPEIKVIMKETGMKQANFYKQMKILVAFQVLIPTYEDKACTKWSYASTFYLNPYMFGRGEWKDIKNLRSYIEINEEGLQLLTQTSKKASIKVLAPGEQQQLFYIDGDYFGVKPKHEEQKQREQLSDDVIMTTLKAVEEQDTRRKEKQKEPAIIIRLAQNGDKITVSKVKGFLPDAGAWMKAHGGKWPEFPAQFVVDFLKFAKAAGAVIEEK